MKYTFGDFFHQQDILGARQYITAASVPGCIDLFLHVGKKIWGMLHLVENDGRRVHVEKSPGVFNRCSPNIRQFEGNVTACIAEKMPEQRGLAGLTRT